MVWNWCVNSIYFVLFYCNLLFSSNCCYMTHTFTPSEAIWQYFLKFIILMNSRPDCKPYQTPSSSCDPCLQILAHYFRQPMFPHRMMVGRYILQVWIFMCWGMTSSLNIHVLGNDIKTWFALLSIVDLGLLENFINFRFLQIFNSWCFPTVMAKQHR